MPMLVPMLNSWLSMLNGSAIICMTRWASVAAADLWSTSPALDDGELVATKPCQRVGFAQGRFEPGRHFPQQRVARRMAKRVVDVLEPVEIQIAGP